ncbi:hypothetical protein BXU11_01330 [Flavobacterium sp. LM5]|nr:hypothetical protein BXU11_01330 [Flavobacterium sp. LM5]
MILGTIETLALVRVEKEVFSQPDVPVIGEVARFATDYFLSKIKFLARNKRVFTTKFAILPNSLLCDRLFCPMTFQFSI